MTRTVKLLPYHNITRFCDNGSSRYALNCVRITNRFIEATDGRILVRVEVDGDGMPEQSLISAEEFVGAFGGNGHKAETELVPIGDKIGVCTAQLNPNAVARYPRTQEIADPVLNRPESERVTLYFPAKELVRFCSYLAEHNEHAPMVTVHCGHNQYDPTLIEATLPDGKKVLAFIAKPPSMPNPEEQPAT